MARHHPGHAHQVRHEGADYGPPRRGTGRHDDEIHDQVCDRLVRDDRVDASQVHVEVEGGVVTLRGQVDSLAAKRAAGDQAWDTLGVVDVNNLLLVPREEPAPG